MEPSWLDNIRTLYLTALEEAYPVEGFLAPFQAFGRDVLTKSNTFALVVLDGNAEYYYPEEDEVEDIPRMAVVMELMIEDDECNAVHVTYTLPHDTYRVLEKAMEALAGELYVSPLGTTLPGKRISDYIDRSKDESLFDFIFDIDMISLPIEKEDRPMAFYVTDKPSFMRLVK